VPLVKDMGLQKYFDGEVRPGVPGRFFLFEFDAIMQS
jgi:hypothetical protein